MIALATKPTKSPIQVKRSPINRAKAPTVPWRVDFPIANSAMIRGMLQRKRKITQGIRKDPPPLAAAILGKRQIFPVPTAIPRTETIRPQREVNRSPPLLISGAPGIRVCVDRDQGGRQYLKLPQPK